MINLINFDVRSQIVGSVQLGKTSVIIELAKLAKQNGLFVIILLNNFKMDLKQFQERAKRAKLSSESLIVTINNKHRLKNISKMIKKINKKIYIIIDESDLFNNCSASKTSEKLIKLLHKSCGFVGITATPHSHMYLNEIFPIFPKNVHYMEHTPDYVSYGHSKFIVKHLENQLYTNSIVDEDYLVSVLQQNKEELFPTKPVVIINISPLNVVHDNICEIIRGSFSDATVIIINKSIIKMIYKNNFYIFDTISKSFEFLQQNEWSMVAIITCKQTGRGISVRSEVNNFNDINQILYANSIIFDCNSIKSTDEIIQSSLRISGKFPGYGDNFKLVLWTSESIDEKIKCQLNMTEDLRLVIKNLKEFPEENEEVVSKYTPPSEVKPHRPYSKLRGPWFCKMINDEYYYTSMSINNAAIVQNIEEFSDIEEDFIRWSSKKLLISKVLKAFINDKYSVQDFKELVTKCGSRNANQFIVNMMTSKLSGSKGNGILLTLDDGYYKIRPEIVELHVKYFK